MTKIATSPRNTTLKDVLVRHCQEDPHRNGLLLLTLPTGFGKTHYVLEYIVEHLKKHFPQRIWFITNLKKNLPYEELRERVGPELFEKHVLFLDSYSAQVCNFLKEGDISNAAKANLKSFKALKRVAEMLERSSNIPEIKEHLQKELSQKERTFRLELRTWLKSYFGKNKKPEKRLKIIRGHSDLQWIEKMYPSVQFFEKKVFFCSIDKFYRYLDTIIGTNIQITTPSYIKENIIFIDEFDATKANIKNAIIENAIKFNQDIVNLFIRIFHGVSTRRFPENQLADGDPDKVQDLQNYFEKIEGRIREVYQKYSFQYHYYHQNETEPNRIFLFHDFEYHTIMSQSRYSGKSFISRRLDTENATNFIEIQDAPPEEDNDNLLYLLNDLRGMILLFSYFVSDYARIYKALHDQSNPEEISIENAIQTTLDIFDLSDKTTQIYFIDQIFQQVYVNQQYHETQFDISPVNSGFRYYDILNRKAHDATSKIMYADTLTTPEAWLVNLCKLANVIGVSATAGFNSPLSNYSLIHLQHHLGPEFRKLNEDDQKVLETEFNLKNKNAKLRTIKTKSVSHSGLVESSLLELLVEKELVSKFLYEFQELQDYDKFRYIKVATVYNYFLEHPDIHSFLCLLNKFPKEISNQDFRIDLLKQLFIELRMIRFQESHEEAEHKVETSVYVLRSKNFEQDQQIINEKLANGGRVFLLSTYQTMGAGQNIQYPIPENIPVVEINDMDYGHGVKDYDGVYLEKPTYLLNYFPNGQDISMKNLLEYLFEVEYLAEGGAISRKEKKERIQYGFKRFLNTQEWGPNNKELYQRQVVAEHFSRVIIQAVGRLSRTRFKSPVVYILYDQTIEEYLRQFHPGRHLLVPEFQALYDHCTIKQQQESKDRSELQFGNVNQSLAFAALLRKFGNRIPNWNRDVIDFWERLRQFVLKNPTISRKDLQNTGLLKYYLQSPTNELVHTYFFRTKDDFRNQLEISFDQKIGAEVSTKGVLLSELMEIHTIRQLFVKEGYAQSFQPNECIISPPLYRNIYLGALGEEIGKHLFALNGIELKLLNEGTYELFDYEISKDIFVDFKFWGKGTQLEAQPQKEKILSKMDKAGAKKVLIVNILTHSNTHQPVFGKDGIIEIPGLINLEEKKIETKIFKIIHQLISSHE